MAQRPSFDMSKLSTATKILTVGSFLYFIDMFLSWNRFCVSGGCVTTNGWHGIGILNGIIVIVILVMEGLTLAGVQMNMGTPALRSMTEAGLAGALLLFTILRVLIKPSIFVVHLGVYIWGWIGLVLAVIVAYGGYMRWQEASVTTPPPPAPGGGFAP